MAIGSYVLFAIYIGIGADFLIKKIKNSAVEKSVKVILVLLTVLFPVALYSNICWLTEKLKIDLVKARYIPYRDNNKFFLVPGKRYEFGPYFYANEVFRTVEPNSIIIADFTPKIVLDYFRIIDKKGLNIKFIYVDYPFVKLNPSIVDMNINKVSIYLASIEFEKDYALDELKKEYRWIIKGPLFQLLKK